jgi:hypothetical protein
LIYHAVNYSDCYGADFDFECLIFSKETKLTEDTEDDSQTISQSRVSFLESRDKRVRFQISMVNRSQKQPTILQFSLISRSVFSKGKFSINCVSIRSSAVWAQPKGISVSYQSRGRRRSPDRFIFLKDGKHALEWVQVLDIVIECSSAASRLRPKSLHPVVVELCEAGVRLIGISGGRHLFISSQVQAMVGS